jgi:hypothetical protein
MHHRFQFGALIVATCTLLCAMLLMALPLDQSTAAQEVAPALRVRTLELVSEDGTVRASFKVEDDGAIVMRLIDQDGNIRVKLGASEEGSGLVLLNEATEPGVHMLTNSAGTTLTLTAKDGQQEIIAP